VIFLETERLVLRDHEPRDLEPFCAMEADPQARRFVGGAPRAQDVAARRFRNRFLRPGRGRLRLWATELKSSGDYVGYAGVYPHFIYPGAAAPGEGCLGFTILREHWGRGYATEAATALVRHGFGAQRLRRIVASVEAGNAASIHILEKLGFRLFRLERAGTRCLYHLELLRPKPTRASTRSK
jgi:[ribosomal protein S5]-alanine N-acetyltransferase